MVACTGAVSSGREGILNYAARVRFLKRLTIRLRWPAIALALLLLALAIASFVYRFSLSTASAGKWWAISVVWGRLNVTQFDSERVPPDQQSLVWGLEFEPQDYLFHGDPEYYYGVSVSRARAPGVDGFAMIPMWYIAAPLSLLAFAGFRLKRREPKPGQCQRCRHPLAGAAVCPECGTPAPVAAA